MRTRAWQLCGAAGGVMVLQVVVFGWLNPWRTGSLDRLAETVSVGTNANGVVIAVATWVTIVVLTGIVVLRQHRTDAAEGGDQRRLEAWWRVEVVALAAVAGLFGMVVAGVLGATMQPATLFAVSAADPFVLVALLQIASWIGPALAAVALVLGALAWRVARRATDDDARRDLERHAGASVVGRRIHERG